MKHIQIFTDGACSGNPGPGGWGAKKNCPAEKLKPPTIAWS